MSTNMIRGINPPKEPRVGAILRNLDFRFTPAEYAFWRARNSRATITFYSTGKLPIQSGSSVTLSEILLGVQEKGQEKPLTRWIGTAEPGRAIMRDTSLTSRKVIPRLNGLVSPQPFPFYR